MDSNHHRCFRGSWLGGGDEPGPETTEAIPDGVVHGHGARRNLCTVCCSLGQPGRLLQCRWDMSVPAFHVGEGGNKNEEIF